MEILGLIAKGLSNQEIADRLFISLSTVKGHNQSIFGKLQVQRRAEAMVRARELGLAQKQYPKQYFGLLIPMPSPCFF
jgi:LuxR family transcriptional regulator, maltose regulon positive regulatory protein